MNIILAISLTAALVFPSFTIIGFFAALMLGQDWSEAIFSGLIVGAAFVVIPAVIIGLLASGYAIWSGVSA